MNDLGQFWFAFEFIFFPEHALLSRNMEKGTSFKQGYVKFETKSNNSVIWNKKNRLFVTYFYCVVFLTTLVILPVYGSKKVITNIFFYKKENIWL